MALAAGSVWEVRPTVGSDTNGAGFVAGASGTDYSQQNSKNTVGNNISTADAVGTGIATITSATASFTAAIVGNIIYLSGTGVTTGWYQVVTFTNATTIILDRSPGTFTLATMNIGGALATVSQANTNAVASNTIWIKATGTYTVTTGLTVSLNSGGSNSPAPGVLGFYGYSSTRGDGGKVTWTTATNSINLVAFSNCSGISFQNIAFTSTAGTPGTALFVNNNQGNNWNLSVKNCTFSGFGVAISALAYGNSNSFPQLIMSDSSVTNCTGTAGVINGSGGAFYNCYFGGNTGHGVQIVSTGVNGSTAVFSRCVFYNNGSRGLDLIADLVAVTIQNCAIVSNTSDGIRWSNVASDGPNFFCQNTVIYGNGGFGINNSLVTTSYGFNFQGGYNAFGSNTSGNYSGLTAPSTDVALSATPFTNAAGGDFSLNSTAGGGALCKSAAWNGGTLFSAQTNALDIGAVQSAGSGGGGGSTTNYIVSKNVTQVFVEDY